MYSVYNNGNLNNKRIELNRSDSQNLYISIHFNSFLPSCRVKSYKKQKYYYTKQIQILIYLFTKQSIGIWFPRSQSKPKTLFKKKIKIFNIITLFYHTPELYLGRGNKIKQNRYGSYLHKITYNGGSRKLKKQL